MLPKTRLNHRIGVLLTPVSRAKNWVSWFADPITVNVCSLGILEIGLLEVLEVLAPWFLVGNTDDADHQPQITYLFHQSPSIAMRIPRHYVKDQKQTGLSMSWREKQHPIATEVDNNMNKTILIRMVSFP